MGEDRDRAAQELLTSASAIGKMGWLIFAARRIGRRSCNSQD